MLKPPTGEAEGLKTLIERFFSLSWMMDNYRMANIKAKK